MTLDIILNTFKFTQILNRFDLDIFDYCKNYQYIYKTPNKIIEIKHPNKTIHSTK